ncbi:MAG: hypothetical protein JW908_00585 [Anaerolineales bacterium]|nr:hypothetical protein [Anaerolineales bacterium]
MASLNRLSVFNARVDSLLQGIGEDEISSADRDLAIRHAVSEYNRSLPKKEALKFLGDGGSYYLVYGKAVDVDEAALDAGIDLASTGADSKLGIKFTLDYSMEIYQVNLWLQRTGASVDGTLAVVLYTISDDLPDQVIATSSTVDIDGVEGAPLGRYDKVVFPFSTKYKLPAGDYAAVLLSSAYTFEDGVTEVILGVDQTDVNNTVFTYDGSDWSEYGTDSAGIIEVIAGIPGWSLESGAIQSVEYPAANIVADETPQLLENEEYELFKTETGDYLHLITVSPPSTEYIRLVYTRPYEWVEATDPLVDLPQTHFEAVCNLSAGIACEWLAAKYGQSVVSSIAADSVDRRTKSDQYLTLSNRFRKTYRALAGLPEKASGPGPGMAIVDIDYGAGFRSDYLFHGRSTR